jgi:hypothetical protein
MAFKKSCSMCGEHKKLSDFHNHPQGRFGKHSWCKRCHTIKVAMYRMRDERPKPKFINVRLKFTSEQWMDLRTIMTNEEAMKRVKYFSDQIVNKVMNHKELTK